MKWRILLFSFCFLSIFGLAHAEADEYIVKLKSLPVSLMSVNEANYNDQFVTVPEDELDWYLKAGLVEYYEPDRPVYLCDTEPNPTPSPTLNPLWHLKATKASFPRQIGIYGNDIKVAVIDTGVQAIGELSGSVLPGYNYISGTTTMVDNVGHGTYVAGLIASSTYGGAYRSKIVPLRTTGPNGGTISNLVKAINDAVDKYDCQVLNMSVAFSGYSKAVEDAVNHATSKGAICVAAGGNIDTTNPSETDYRYPAAYNNVIAVSAINPNVERAYFSVYNDSIWVAAPGQVITSVAALLSTDPKTGIETYFKTPNNGTSFSAPMVSALAAAAKSVEPDMDFAEFRDLVATTATDIGVPGYDVYFGYGLLNCENFWKTLIGDRVFLSPIDSNQDTATCTVYNHTAMMMPLHFIFSCYGQNQMTACNITDVTLEGEETYSFSNPVSGGTYKFMAWSQSSHMNPVTSVREK